MSKAKPQNKAKVPAALPLQQDLVVLAADKDTREAIEGLLTPIVGDLPGDRRESGVDTLHRSSV
jgi:hypothetical protein